MSDELLRICAAELFYEVSPQISPDALCAELQKRCGNVDKIKTGEDAFLFPCWDFSSEFNDGTIPAHIVLAHSSDAKSQIEKPLAYLAPPKADSSLRSE
jgi:hypothetical protein